MTTRSQKRKAVAEIVSASLETPLTGDNDSENPVAGTTKSPKLATKKMKG